MAIKLGAEDTMELIIALENRIAGLKDGTIYADEGHRGARIERCVELRKRYWRSYQALARWEYVR